MPKFDRYAKTYDAALSRALTVSGESKDYFARARIVYLKGCLDTLKAPVKSVLDFGCGIGSGSKLLGELLGAEDVVGVDVSPRSIQAARQSYPDMRFVTLNEYEPTAEIDLVFCNGVFHHIPLAERPAVVGLVFRALRRGSFFAFWENNPWNPGARYVMARCDFDRDAVMLSARQARRLLRTGGFAIVRTNFQFIFPRWLGFFRGLEPWLSPWPFGAQYQVLCQKPP
jgi:SAM-dependent methyltransferase